MKVAEVRDGEAFQSRWPAAKRNLLSNDSRTVRRDQCGVDRESAHTRNCCKPNKVSSGSRKKRQSVLGPLAPRIPQHALYLQHTPNLQIRDMDECCTRTQKLNKACSSIFRLAALPGENGPPS